MRADAHALRLPPLGLAVLAAAAAAALPPPVHGQERDVDRRAHHAERLEAAVDSLEELGQREIGAAVRRVLDELRRDREDDEVREVRRRLRIMRDAVDAFVAAGDLAAAETVERAMHVRELAIEGRREQAAELRHAAPDRRQLADALRAASGLRRERGELERADSLRDVSDQLARQAERIALHAAGRGDVGELTNRIEIVRMARAAHAEAGRKEGREELEQFLRVAELQRDEAPIAERTKAFEGLTIGRIIERLGAAAELYRRWDMGDRADACSILAAFYTARQRGQAPAAPTWSAPENLEDLAARVEIFRQVRDVLRDTGRSDAAAAAERIVELGELQVAKADAEAIANAAQGITNDQILELTRTAVELFRDRGDRARADACAALAQFYVDRRRTNAARRESAASEKAAAAGERALAELEAEVERLEAMLDQLSRQLERVRRR